MLNIPLLVFGSFLSRELASGFAEPMVPTVVPSQTVDEAPRMIGSGLLLFAARLLRQETGFPSMPPAQMVGESSAKD
jgi:hypothetical protein